MNPVAAPACANCGAAMQVLRLAGHYGATVEIELCAPCHLVWFDVVESARLAGPGLLALVGAMAAAQSLAHQPLRRDLACPHCHGAVRTVHNRTRWGRSLQLECAQRHGAWQTFGEFLAEKGLVRPLSAADRARARPRPQGLACINCGGAIGAADAACPWCTSVPALVDVARLAHALDPEGATADHAVHRRGERAAARNCRACGAPVAADAAWHCTNCGATLTAPGLAEAHRELAALGPALRAHAAKPAPHVVQQRLQAQAAGLQRQRERAAEMQAEADQRSGAAGWGPADDVPPAWRLPAWVWGLIAALVAIVWNW